MAIIIYVDRRMLSRLEIRNFAIIDQVELELAPGLTMLTGETGAGKSILLDAIGLVLGDRADANTIRSGAARAEISAEFNIANQPEVAAWLIQQELDQDGECVIRRVISAERGARSTINGRSVTAMQLRELGELLVEIHGQHEHQRLLQRTRQRELLDDYGGYVPELTAVTELYQSWRAIQDELERLQGLNDERDQRMEWLRFQTQELVDLAPKAGEAAELEREFRRSNHLERLLQQGHLALELVYEGEEAAAYRSLSQAVRILEELQTLDTELAPAIELLAGALVQLQEGADTLRRHLDHLEIDPERLQWLDQRLATLLDLARKHRVDPDALPEQLERLQRELADLEQLEEQIAALRAEQQRLSQAYLTAAAQLGEARRQAAARLGERVTATIAELGMPNGVFQIAVTSSGERFTPQGLDQVEFMVTLNPGQPLRPLHKIASGGELSRIGLAIHVVAAHQRSVPCMIFDEVDTGVGGAVAEMVGRKLADLARSRQVLCITHLPQVAAYAHHHLHVRKETDGRTTSTRIQPLNAGARIDELARMLGGIEITSRTRAHAQEMIDRAASCAQQPEAGQPGS